MRFSKEQFQVLKVKDFRHFLIARFLYITSLRIIFVTVGYLVDKITNSKVQLGLIGLSEVIPAIGLALYAGVIVDKADKRKLILRAELFVFLIALLQVALIYFYDASLIKGQTLVYCLYLCMFMGGIIRAFNGPAQNAIIAQIVDKEQLVSASTLSSMSWLLAAIVGALIAGILLYMFPPVYSFTVSAALVLLALLFMRTLKPTAVLVSKKANNWEAIKIGLRFVWQTKIILNAITLDLFAVLFGGAIALLPVFAREILHVNEVSLGWLNAAEYIGSFLIMILLLFLPMRKKQGQKLLIAVAGFGLCTILFALSTNFWLSMFALICVGLFDGVSVVIRGNIMQLYTPDDMRGRVASVNSMFINSSNEIGQFESGIAAWAVGTQLSVVLGGCITIALVLLVWWRSAVIRNLNY